MPVPVAGAAGSASYAYFIDDYTLERCYPLPLTDSATVSDQMYLPTSLTYFDIAYEGTPNSTGDFWVACDHPDSPIRAYRTGFTNPVGALDLLPQARGLAFHASAGHRYIWASNPVDNVIYQIDLDASTGVGDAAVEPIVPVSLNSQGSPFTSSVVITGSGFGSGALIEVYDVSGHRVLEAAFTGSFSWDGADSRGDQVPAGVYYVRVHGAGHAEAGLSVVRI